MAYYHVRITQASRRARDEVRLDISFEELERRFLTPYRLGHPIAINGKSIPANDIERIRISATEDQSEVHRAAAQRHKIRTHSILSIEWLVAERGVDVTNTFITGAPGTSEEIGADSGNHVDRPVDAARILVVHGRNMSARDALFSFLRSIELRPIEWSEAVKETGQASPYIGQVLDTAFATAQAVVVLLTPDDEARLREALRATDDLPHEARLTGQARPNVLFEAGMAMERDQRRTVLVEIGALRPFSDIAGRHTIRLNNTTERRQELAQRLEAAGCPVNRDGTDWHTTGDFDAALGDE